MQAGPTVFRNDLAVVGWVFMAIVLAMLCLITWLFLRDGGFHQFHPLLEAGIMLTFWAFGLAAGAELLAAPRVRVTIAAGEAVIRERLPFRRSEERVPVAALDVPPVHEEKDSDGDPTFRCVVVTPAGRRVVVGESRRRPTVEATRDRLLAALGR